ncbi:MAG: sulfite exporter TauE/SafE family protein [Verrucomicrobiales bacterium]
MKLLLITTLVGIAAGLLGALCGVGGGILLVPAFTAILGLSQKQAVATSLAVIIITASASTLNNGLNSEKLIDWRLVALTGLGAALASWFGSDLMRSLSNQHLTRLFAIVLIIAGTRMLIKG